jgi:hypothetical protein
MFEDYQMEKLKIELCKLILSNMGMVKPPNFGKSGISINDFLLNINLSVEFEEDNGNIEVEKYGLWCGYVSYMGMRIRALGTDICDNKNNSHEFIVVYCLDNGPFNAIKYSTNSENCFFMVKGVENTKCIWKNANIYDMLTASAGFYKISDLGVLWYPCKEYEDLYKVLVEVVGLG